MSLHSTNDQRAMSSPFAVPLDSTQRYRIVHTTTMAYNGDVTHSHNELRMTPITEPGQTTLDSRLRVKPMTWSNTYRDHWGSSVMVAECAVRHNSLDIEATSVVERYDTGPIPASMGWEALSAGPVVDQLSEYLAATERTSSGPQVLAIAQKARTLETPRAAAEAISTAVRERMEYRPGVTGVHSTAQEAWEEEMGVCQDFAHITLGALREIGVPARYVSGYLAPSVTSAIGETGYGESHAWLEFWDGAWIGIDPTNGRDVGLDHIVVGRGRDYGDIAPFRGMYSGPKVSSFAVQVSFTRIA